MKEIEIGKIIFDLEEKLTGKQTHLFRGYIAKIFKQNEIIHNHDLTNGKCKYHYPLIQYKIIDGKPMILGIGSKAINILKAILCQIRHIKFKNDSFKILKSYMEITQESIGISHNTKTYELVSPWLSLNSENYKKYTNATVKDQNKILNRCLAGNILSLSKYLDYTVCEKIVPETKLFPKLVNLKGQKMTGFYGSYSVNFYLPDYIGIGKSCSRGYGSCVNISNS